MLVRLAEVPQEAVHAHYALEFRSPSHRRDSLGFLVKEERIQLDIHGSQDRRHDPAVAHDVLVGAAHDIHAGDCENNIDLGPPTLEQELFAEHAAEQGSVAHEEGQRYMASLRPPT